jgi:hypothetical protein
MIKLLDYWPDCSLDDVELLKNGRIFWLSCQGQKTLIVVGRDAADDANLAKLAKKGDIMVELKEENGPTTLVRNLGEIKQDDTIMNIIVPEHLSTIHLNLNENCGQEKILEKATWLTGFYATKVRGKSADVKIMKIS